MANRTETLSEDGTTLEERRVQTTPTSPSFGLIHHNETLQSPAGQALARSLDPLNQNGKAKLIAVHNNKRKKARKTVEDRESFKAMGRITTQVVARALERDAQSKMADEDSNLSVEGKSAKQQEIRDSYHADLSALMEVFGKAEREFRRTGTNGKHPPRTAEEMLGLQQAVANVDQYLPEHSIETGRLAIETENLVLLEALVPKWQLAERQALSGQKKHFGPYAEDFAELIADAKLVTATSEGLAHQFASERADTMRSELRSHIAMLETTKADDQIFNAERGGIHPFPSFLPEDGGDE